MIASSQNSAMPSLQAYHTKTHFLATPASHWLRKSNLPGDSKIVRNTIVRQNMIWHGVTHVTLLYKKSWKQVLLHVATFAGRCRTSTFPCCQTTIPLRFFFIFLGFLVLKIKLRIRQMELGTSRRLQTRYERLWADQVVELQIRLLVMNETQAFDATNPNNIVRFHGIVMHRLLTEEELDDLHLRGTGERAPFVAGGVASSS